jgi:uncharacterized protein
MPRKPLPSRSFLSLRSSGIHGRGVYAKQTIPKGSRIVEYRGERISQGEADRRYPDDESVPHHTFLFAVDDDVVIDAAFGGSIARWINHSCEPNCESIVEDGRVFIDSIGTIRPGEELSYDYNFILDEPHTPAAKRRYACICGRKKCRATLLGKKR